MSTTRQAHPLTALFPMLPDDELADLAADIKTNGLLQPITLDAEGRVLDGRNRLRACEIAEVKPRFTTYTGENPDAYALSVNLARRHLSKGQRAMVAAKARLVSNHSTRAAAHGADVSQARVAQAATVLEHAPDLADAVVAATKPLDEAYKEARERKRRSAPSDDRRHKERSKTSRRKPMASTDGEDAEDAKEYTETLLYVIAGCWRQILLAEKLGVAKALGLSHREWVENQPWRLTPNDEQSGPTL
jgi:ParB-like chromosome segregation protein Spo0J